MNQDAWPKLSGNFVVLSKAHLWGLQILRSLWLKRIMMYGNSLAYAWLERDPFFLYQFCMWSHFCPQGFGIPMSRAFGLRWGWYWSKREKRDNISKYYSYGILNLSCLFLLMTLHSSFLFCLLDLIFSWLLHNTDNFSLDIAVWWVLPGIYPILKELLFAGIPWERHSLPLLDKPRRNRHTSFSTACFAHLVP